MEGCPIELGLRGKTVLVTGSSRGIGLAIAGAFLAEGARVCVTGRDESTLKRAVRRLARRAPGRVLSFAGDLTNAATIAACLEQIRRCWRRLDITVANIGSGQGRPFAATEPSDWDASLRTNLLSGVFLARQAMALMARGGAFCFISSIAGVESLPAPVPYIAAKAGVIAAAKALARELAPRRIRVNVVAPGNIFVAGGTWDRKRRADARGVAAYLETAVPMRRLGTPEEVASVVVFLCAAPASFVTGACWIVDGGQTHSH